MLTCPPFALGTIGVLRRHTGAWMTLFWLALSAQVSFGADAQVTGSASGVLQKYHAHIEGLHDHQPGERGVCLTSLIQELRREWASIGSEDRAEITENLAPFKRDLFEPLVPRFDHTPPPNAASESCWGEQKDRVINSEHFSVQWDEGVISEAQAAAFSNSLEESWEVEVNELGWRKPDGSNLYLMLVLVEDLGGTGAGAYTTVDSCGMGYLPYVVASPGSFSMGEWYKTMACHELHHAIQYSYGFAHEFWWWEATATWVEDLVYPHANDWANALYMFAQTPHLGMNASAGGSNDQQLFWHTYGMGVWGMFLDQHVGGNALVRATWEAVADESCQYCAWMPDVMEDVGEDFDALMAEFMAHTSVMNYRDRNMLTDVKRSDEVRNLPAEDYAGGDKPQSLGLNIIEFDRRSGESGKMLEVTFDGSNDADRWNAVLALGESTLDAYVVFELDESGQGVATIPFDGSTTVQLIVSPVDSGAKGYSYNWRSADDFGYVWSAQLVDESASEGEGDGDGVVGAGGEEDEPYDVPLLPPRLEDEKGLFGCTTMPSTPQPWLVFVLFGLIGARRQQQ